MESKVNRSAVEIDGVEDAMVTILPMCTDLAEGCIYTDPDTGVISYIFRDLADLEPGEYTLRAKWMSDTGIESDYSLPFIYDTLVPTEPSIRLIP